jgi:hypothetical protein
MARYIVQARRKRYQSWTTIQEQATGLRQAKQQAIAAAHTFGWGRVIDFRGRIRFVTFW